MATEKRRDRDKIFDFQPSKVRGSSSAEYVRTLMVLKQQENIIEKSLNSLIVSMKASSEIGRDIQRENIRFSDGRAQLFDSLKGTLHDIADELRFVKSTIQNISDIDVDKYRSKLKSLWRKMDEFNKSNILDTLIKEQSQIDLELSTFNDQLHKYESSKREAKRHSIYYAKSFENCNVYNGTKNFESLVARTGNLKLLKGRSVLQKLILGVQHRLNFEYANKGHTQRWTDEDHLLFLKLRQKCKTIPALVTALQSRCPDLSTECIVNHEAWYRLYLELRQKQKDQIQEWRKLKQKQQHAQRQRRETSSDDNDESTVSDVSKRQIEISDNGPDRAFRVEIMRKSKIVDDIKNEEKKQMIRQWKMEKESQRMMEDKELKERMKMKQAEQEKLRQARIYKMKIELMEYKKKKMMEEERKFTNYSEQCQQRNENQTNQWKKTFQAFRQQDQRFIQKRRLLIQQRKAMMNRQKILNYTPNFKGHLPANANNQNFLKSTKGWEQKCRFFNSTQKQTPRLTYIKDLPRLRTFHRRNVETF